MTITPGALEKSSTEIGVVRLTLVGRKRNANRIGTIRPGIGIAFIELVTQKNAGQFYETASNLYYWGFSNMNVLNMIEKLKRKMNRIQSEQKKISRLIFPKLNQANTNSRSKLRTRIQTEES